MRFDLCAQPVVKPSLFEVIDRRLADDRWQRRAPAADFGRRSWVKAAR
jgi:hypothetical protein